MKDANSIIRIQCSRKNVTGFLDCLHVARCDVTSGAD